MTSEPLYVSVNVSVRFRKHSNDIVSMWKQHYAAIFNSVENSSCDQAHSDFCNTNIAFDNAMTVDLFEMKAVIDDLYPSHTALRERRDASVTETGRLLRDFYNTLCSGHTARLLRDSFTTD